MENYVVQNVTEYADDIRETAASFLNENHKDDLDLYITIPEVISIIYEKCDDVDENKCPIISVDSNDDIFNTVTAWIHGIALAELAGQDLVQSAWDSDNNCMIFSVNKDSV